MHLCYWWCFGVNVQWNINSPLVQHLPADVSSCLSCPTPVNQLQKCYPFRYVLKHIQSLLKYIYSVFVYVFKRKSTCGYLYMHISRPVFANQCVCLSCRCSRGLVSRNIAQFESRPPPSTEGPQQLAEINIMSFSALWQSSEAVWLMKMWNGGAELPRVNRREGARGSAPGHQSTRDRRWRGIR